jgi:hypothetical protein
MHILPIRHLAGILYAVLLLLFLSACSSPVDALKTAAEDIADEFLKVTHSKK